MSAGAAPIAPNSACPHCGARFRCGMENGDKECWCARLPNVLPLPVENAAGSPATSCLCPACLNEILPARDLT